MGLYADILIPLAIDIDSGVLTYEVDTETLSDLREGEAVAVPIGKSTAKFYTGIVWRIHSTRPDLKRVRVITKRLYDSVLLSAEQRKFWEWLSEYYIAPLSSVMQVALPALVKPSGEDEAMFEMAEYVPSKELYISLINGCDAEQTKILSKDTKLSSALKMILESDKSTKTRAGEIPRRLLKCEKLYLNQLAIRGVIELNEREPSVELFENIEYSLPKLSEHQKEALAKIVQGHETKLCALLHGVTGSGKTEVYIHLIARELAAGRDVLMLLPEIALTTQLIERLSLIFGSRVTPYHSKIPPKRRTEIFMQMSRRKEGDAGQFIVGARSAIFLPLSRLSLIIVDEEHDSSFKQLDRAPLYNGRDAAHILASLYGAKLLLGSATPSLESWTNGISGKFAMATLTERYADAQMPEIIISDSMRAGKRRERKGHFNLELLRRLEGRLEGMEQSMLFQNRRGFAPYVECPDCGWVARCPNCNVSLTMHKGGGALKCHYCDYMTALPTLCPSCKVGEVKPVGFGTEKIEEEISQLLPEARTVRLDRDTATSQGAFERIVGSFSRGESDILIGTQMIAKGFDFSKVTLVGILSADNMLNNPDFRAEERAFSLMLQVAGRAGRRQGAKAEVVIQTAQPDHRIMKFVADGDYDTMARTLLREREEYFYPPYSRIIMIVLRHTDKRRLDDSANGLSRLLRGRFGARVKGPVAPPVDRVGGVWIVNFMLKIESGASSKRARAILREVRHEWLGLRAEYKTIHLSFNVDPQ